jgi:hypothetical protein
MWFLIAHKISLSPICLPPIKPSYSLMYNNIEIRPMPWSVKVEERVVYLSLEIKS